MSWFGTNTVGTVPICRKGKQRGWQNALFSLARNQSPSAYLFTQLFVYWRRRDSFLHLLKGNKKAPKRWQEQSEVCHKMDALQIEGDKHNVVYVWGARQRGWAWSPPPPCTQGPPYTHLETERDLAWLGFRVAWLRGLCHRSRRCVVTRLSNRERRFFSAPFRLATHGQTRPLNLQNKTLQRCCKPKVNVISCGCRNVTMSRRARWHHGLIQPHFK